MIVYIHRNPQTYEIFYVGIGSTTERAYRFQSGKRNKYWIDYIRKYGFPIVEIIHQDLTKEEAARIEIELIAKYGKRIDGTGTLLNLSSGGESGAYGVKQSRNHIEKRASKLKGYKHSEQSKQNMKEAQNRPEVKAKHEAYKKDPNWLKLQRDAKLGNKLSAETKIKISNALKGIDVSAETKQKISIANTGKIRTEEQRARISESKKGAKRNPDSVKKMAETNKKTILNTQTGIFYNGIADAALSANININTLRAKMSGHAKNNTPFIYC